MAKLGTFAAELIGEGDCAYGAKKQIEYWLKRWGNELTRAEGHRFIEKATAALSDCYNDRLHEKWANHCDERITE